MYTQIVDKSTYLCHLSQSDVIVLNQLESKLPESFWIVEVSIPELYTATRAKVGDIVLSCHSFVVVGTARGLEKGIASSLGDHSGDLPSKRRGV